MGNGTDLFIYLLQSKPDVDSPDQWGRTALSWAAEYGLLAVVKVLLEQGANVNASDYEGGAPLTWLIHAGNPEMANLAATEAYLKERGAKEVNRATTGYLLSQRNTASATTIYASAARRGLTVFHVLMACPRL
jgi:ankyrin repeat protein